MFSVDRDFGSTTSNISCCSGAPGVPSGGPGNGAAKAHRAHSLTVRCDTYRHHWLAKAPRETRLTTAAEAAWLAADSFLSRRTRAQRSRALHWIGLWLAAFSLIGVVGQRVQTAAPVTLPTASVVVLLIFTSVGAVVFFGLGLHAVVHLVRVRVARRNGTAR